MNPSRSQPDRSISQRASAEAAAWVVRLQGPRRDTLLEKAWRAWIDEHPAHLFAWELASETWAASHSLPPDLTLPRIVHRNPQLRARRFVQIAAVLAVCTLAMLGWGWKHFGRSAVTTEVGEQRILNLADGTRVELNTNSRLIVQYHSNERRVILDAGEAFFAVAHETRPFVVYVGDRKIVALGTSFVVRRDEKSRTPLTITLIEGRVAVADAGSADEFGAASAPKVTMLKSGQRLAVRRDARMTVDFPAMEPVIGWMRGQVIFDKTPLSEAAADLNRYSTLQITMASSLANISIGGSFRVGESESFARAVAQSYHLRLVEREHEFHLEPME